jgi:hypothetical protein
MKLAVITFPENNYFHEIAEQLIEENLVRYASEAADEMEFEKEEELLDAVKRSMELCVSAGLPVNANFKRIYKSWPDGIHFDWKLSVLAFYLVKLNGDPANHHVAELQIHLLKEQQMRSFPQYVE